MALASHAANPLSIPDTFGGTQSIHPKVIDTHEVMGAGNSWQGHRYWMAYTPYPNGLDSAENPCIVVSDDRVTWAAPAGVTNPLVSAPATAGRFNSDTDMLLEPDGSALHIVFRECGVNAGELEEVIYKITSSDGVNWSAPVELFRSGEVDKSKLLLSPALVNYGDTYAIYTVANTADYLDYQVGFLGYRTASSMDGPWSAETRIAYPVTNGEIPWHMSIRQEPNGVLRFVLDMVQNIGLGIESAIWLGDAPGLGITPTNMVELLRGGAGGWDDNLYRACIIPLDADGEYGLYYSAIDSVGEWRTGYTTFSHPLPVFHGIAPTQNVTVEGVNADYNYEQRVRTAGAGNASAWSAWEPVPSALAPPVPSDTPGTTDTTPDAFTLTDLTDQPLSTLAESNPITVAGVTDATDIPISVTGGEYAVSVDDGVTWSGWTSAATTVQLNNQVKVRHTTSAANSTSVNTTLTIGGVSDTFTTTTEAPTADTTAPVISIVSISTQDTTPIVSGTCDDATATLTLTLDGATYSPAATSQWTQQVNELAVGSHTATLTATDPAGNSSTATATITIQPTESTTTFAITGFGDGTAFPGETMVITCSGDIGETPGSVRLMDSDESTSVAQSIISWNVATAEITITVQQGNLPYGDGTQKVRVARADTLTQTFSGITLIPETGAAFRDLVNPGNGAGTAGALLDQVLTTGAQVSWRDINTLGIAIAADGTVSSTGYGAFYLRAWVPSTERWGSYKLVTLSEPAGTPVAPMIQSVGPIEGFPDIFPDSMDWELRFRDQVFASDLNGIESSLELPGAKWAISMTFGQREGREGRRLAAFLASQKGKIGRFNVTPATFAPPAGTAKGQPLVRGPNQTGNTLVTDGWLANQPEALAIGDYFSVNGELKMVTDPVIVDANGLAIIHFAPNLHQAPPDNAEIRVTRPMVRVKLMSNARWMLNHPVLYGIKVDCMEALDV